MTNFLEATSNVAKSLEGLTKDDAKRVLAFVIDCVDRGPDQIPLSARKQAAQNQKGKASAAPGASGEAAAN